MKFFAKTTIVLLLLCVNHQRVQAQISENEIKAAYIERFTRFIEWPVLDAEEYENSSFRITVLGDNTFGTSLDNLFKERKIKKLPVVINYLHDYKTVHNTDMLIICSSEKNNLSDILDFMASKPVLIVSDRRGFAQKGTHINMYVENANIRYEINQKAIEKAGLTISSLLLVSAKIVKTDE